MPKKNKNNKRKPKKWILITFIISILLAITFTTTMIQFTPTEPHIEYVYRCSSDGNTITESFAGLDPESFATCTMGCLGSYIDQNRASVSDVKSFLCLENPSCNDFRYSCSEKVENNIEVNECGIKRLFGSCDITEYCQGDTSRLSQQTPSYVANILCKEKVCDNIFSDDDYCQGDSLYYCSNGGSGFIEFDCREQGSTYTCGEFEGVIGCIPQTQQTTTTTPPGTTPPGTTPPETNTPTTNSPKIMLPVACQEEDKLTEVSCNEQKLTYKKCKDGVINELVKVCNDAQVCDEKTADCISKLAKEDSEFKVGDFGKELVNWEKNKGYILSIIIVFLAILVGLIIKLNQRENRK